MENMLRWSAPSRLPPLRLHDDFRSRFLPRSRTITVLLPPDYDANPRRRYPVLYLHDGQNVFEQRDKTAFGKGTWRVDTTIAALLASRIVEPLIMVAVDNTPDRMAEYTPVPDPKYGGGNGEAYGRFLVEELKPFIDAQYRTRTGPIDTALAGSSLGGLATLCLGLRSPQVFGKWGILSPSVWWADRRIVTTVAALPTRPKNTSLYLSIGTDEGFSSLPDARLLRDRLQAKGWTIGKDLLYEEALGDKHDEPAWAKRVPSLLRFFFPA